MATIAPALQTLYADLVQSLALPDELAGSVFTQSVKGQDYLYVFVRTGRTRRKHYLGRADDDAVRARGDAIRNATQRAKYRRKAVSALRSAGLPGPDQELGAVLEVVAAAGLFQRGAVLVGTSAFQCYSPMIGHVLPAAGMMTRDADIPTASLALSAPMQAPEEPGTDGKTVSFEEILRAADPTFSAVPMLERKALPSRFRAASGFLVEILVPLLRRTDRNPMPIPGLRAGGAPIQHMGWLIEDPVAAVALHGSGVAVRVPQPVRYAVHKLLISQKRVQDSAKAAKDLLQAGALIRALQDTMPDAIQDALDDARGRGLKGWADPINRSLRALSLDRWLD
jgi:hypothetical protein